MYIENIIYEYCVGKRRQHKGKLCGTKLTQNIWYPKSPNHDLVVNTVQSAKGKWTNIDEQ